MNTVPSFSPLVALVGNPNCGKTALFNRLTGARQKVANFAGVTVERKIGRYVSGSGRTWQILDLPGTYSINASTPDEQITQAVITGQHQSEAMPDALVCVVDATNLRRGLRIALELKQLNLPMVLAVNMMDVADKRKIQIDLNALSAALAMPVVETVAVRAQGEASLLAALEKLPLRLEKNPPATLEPTSALELQKQVNQLLKDCVNNSAPASVWTEKIDRIILHPILGTALFLFLMFLVFQAVFSWAEWPMEIIKASVEGLGDLLHENMSEGVLRDLLTQGIIGGSGAVLVFLPQIVILFFFILVLEDSGYLPRAAFLLDRLMGSVGLSGRAFIPLLSSFACAIPGIMSTRTIQNPRDRLITIMIAPLMTCSARLPVYALIIAAFIPNKPILGILSLQGLVLFILYLAGILSAMLVAWVMKPRNKSTHALMLELPDYRWPNLRNLGLGLWERIRIFTTRVGTIILALMVLLWFLSSFPGAPDNATHPAIYYSIAGMLGRGLEVIFAPIGFNWQICIALVPGMAAREVAVAALGTVYALSQHGDNLAQTLQPLIAQSWSLPTALSLLAWFVFAPQCIATLSVVKRETNSWRYPLIMVSYLFGLAYLASFLTYRIALFFLG
ncbi:ferrous iron transporter B [Solimicrobium silvestre]|uniref:Ferrous iron transport protein B n=1 Tax=Solimicrobium silvestre TaxID=2099400 RepID=A0A2S9GSS2_9BURK|nr:ferrous iron transporter B [Solimicrobium silvestre]PRC90769.1 Fe2+ transport system protein B [Solimicrobium silvestre]